jgi:hypothetical protein
MFGLQFLFMAALWALPLAMLPLLLHLLLRRKSPVVLFPTLRFVQASLQQTAARRKVQRWLLLALRVLLLALLIWAVAQPAKVLANRWFASGSNVTAVIVVDTSYSMQLNDQQITLLAKADGIVGELLRGELQDATVAVLTSRPPSAGTPERFRSATAILAEWTPLQPQPAVVPLVDRIAAASELLSRQPQGQKWLFVLSDFQSREFPRALPENTDEHLHIIAIDLHPNDARSAGVTRIALDPAQPIPGIRSIVTVDVAGRSGDVKPVALRITDLDGKELLSRTPQMASLTDAGTAQVRFDVELPAERWQLITATIPAEDSMPWDNQRTAAIEVGQRQKAAIIDRFAPREGPTLRFVRLALDPNEGRLSGWPLDVKQSAGLSGQEQLAVVPLTDWPDAQLAGQLRDFARSGGTVVLMIRPGLEAKWTKLSDGARSALHEILPSQPLPASVEEAHYTAQATSAGRATPQFKGLLDDAAQVAGLSVQRVCPFSIDDPRSTDVVLSLQAANRTDSASRQSLLFRRKVGAGTVYTWTVLPDTLTTNLPTHPLFMPMLVSMSLRQGGASSARNVEIGNSLTLDGLAVSAYRQLDLRAPAGDLYRVDASTGPAGRQFVFDKALTTGIYTWHQPQAQPVVGISCLQPPSLESDLAYRPPAEVLPPGDRTVIARSLEDLQIHLSKVSEPQPKWALPMAIVLAMLCVESLLSSSSGLWKMGGRWLGAKA